MDMDLLQKVANGELTPAQADAEQKKRKQKPLTMKKADKGGISVYGLGRFPVTLYPSQWIRLRDETIDGKPALDAVYALAEEMLLAEAADAA